MTDAARDEAAEARVATLLAELRSPAAAGEPVPPEPIVRTARWQRALRGPLRAGAFTAAALVDGLGLLLGIRRGGRP